MEQLQELWSETHPKQGDNIYYSRPARVPPRFAPCPTLNLPLRRLKTLLALSCTASIDHSWEQLLCLLLIRIDIAVFVAALQRWGHSPKIDPSQEPERLDQVCTGKPKATCV